MAYTRLSHSGRACRVFGKERVFRYLFSETASDHGNKKRRLKTLIKNVKSRRAGPYAEHLICLRAFSNTHARIIANCFSFVNLSDRIPPRPDLVYQKFTL